MTARWPTLLVVVALVAVSCSGGGKDSASTTEKAQPGSTRSVGTQLDVAAIAAAAAAFTTSSLTGRDLLDADLLAATGLSAALGDDASWILGLADAARSGANAKLRPAAEIGGNVGQSRRLLSANDFMYLAILLSLPISLDPLTSHAPSNEQDAETKDDTETEPGTGKSATSTTKQTIVWTVTNSRVQISIHRIEHVVVTDSTSGATIFESSYDRTATGVITVCPDTAGVANASVSSDMTMDATKHPGPGGHVGVHTVGAAHTASTFTGQVDDAAALETVNQEFEKTSDWKTSASADGGPTLDHGGSLDVAFTGLTAGLGSSSELDVGTFDTSKIDGHADQKGNATQEMIDESIGNAMIDVMTIRPSYVEAQRLWRNGRCVVVTAPGYDAETPVPVARQDISQHTEKVDKGSTTKFDAKLRHRWDGGALTSEVISELVEGNKSLDPKSLAAGAGTLVYVAPDENGKEATAKLSSTSNRGIGTLLLTFSTATEQLQVIITGTEVFDDFIPSTVTVSPVLLTKLPDGTFAGTASSSVVGTFEPCGTALTETSTIGLTATQAKKADGTPGDWSIVSAPVPTNSKVTVQCEGTEIKPFAALFGGVGYNFVNDLGTITVPPEGGTATLHTEGSYGPLDATVVVKVLTGTG